MQFESSLERDMITLLEYDDQVEIYTPQPVTIYYENGAKQCRYTPDLAVYYRPGIKRKPELIEIKYKAELDEKQAEYAARFAAAEKYAAANGYIFKIVTEKEIRNDHLYNIKFLSRYRRTSADNIRKESILSKFNKAEQWNVRDLSGDDPVLLYTVWQLVAQKALCYDMNQKLNMDTLLWKTD